MANFDCFVRIYLPLNADGTPQPLAFGRFDLQINSINGAQLVFDSHTAVVNPVFRFEGQAGAGYVKIFSEARTRQVQTNDCLLCKYHFIASDTAVMSFVQMLQGMLTFVAGNTDKDMSLYRVTTGPFQTYTTARNNSFGATAIWCSALGMSILNNIYNTTEAQLNYMTYASWELFDQLFGSWQFDKLLR